MRWDLDSEQKRFLEFTRKMVQLRNVYPVLQRQQFFTGAKFAVSGDKDISWLHPSGKEMTPVEWNSHVLHCIGIRLQRVADEGSKRQGNDGQKRVGSSLLILINSDRADFPFTLPSLSEGRIWSLLIDTTVGMEPVGEVENPFHMQSHSLALLEEVPDKIS